MKLLTNYKDFKVNDLVTSYFSGIWRIVKIIDREDGNLPLVKLEKITKDLTKFEFSLHKGKPVIKECSIYYCLPIKSIIESCEALLIGLKSLETHDES